MSARRPPGFTLIELLIAAAVVAIVGTFLMRTFTVNHRAYVVVDQVAESQQSMRAVAEILERDARHAGFMVPEAAAACGVDSTSGPDLLYLSDSDAIDPQTDKAIYAGALLSGANVGTGSNTLPLSALVIEPSPPSRPAYDSNGDGTNDSDFRRGGGVIVIDAGNPDRGAACGRVESVDLANDEIDVVILSSALAAPGATVDLRAIPAHEYAINGTHLERDGLLLSGGVEDLQIAYFFDANDNWTPDAGEYRGIDAADYVAQDENAEELREIRVNLVVRSRQEDVHFTGGLPQELENRSFGGGPPPDGFRRRVHTTRLMIRNLGSRL